ncbi:MAG: hypothetical protein ABJB47_08855 [Actinomycetota bacterium]
MTGTAPATTALTVLELLQEGQYSQIRDLCTAQLRTLAAPEVLQTAWEGALRQYGQVTATGTPVSEPAGTSAVVVKIPVTCERGALTLLVTVGQESQLASLQLAPAGAAEPTEPWQPPAYADPAAFGEQDVTIGSGPLAVPGTLSLPHGAGPQPAVVLLSGSGPGDRDETYGRNKPFKDLAWGLASRGVAVLRFDKVTHAYRDLAGGAQPLHWAIVWQARYLASLDPAMTAAEYEPAQHMDPEVVAGIAQWLTSASRQRASDCPVAAYTAPYSRSPASPSPGTM